LSGIFSGAKNGDLGQFQTVDLSITNGFQGVMRLVEWQFLADFKGQGETV
jgi:hypothetical protein